MAAEFLLLLGLPLAGGLALALFGHWARAAELNVAFSTLTFFAAVALVARVVAWMQAQFAQAQVASNR